MKILVTGGNGFIASHLCEALVNSGYEVTCFDKDFDSNTKNLECEKISGDIYNYELFSEKFSKSNIVIHLAAISRVDPCQEDPIGCYQTNVMAVLKIIKALKKSKTKLIFGSSREVYGEAKSIPVTETHQKNPLTVYGASKLAAEQLLKTYQKLFGLNFVTLRFANVYGSPRDLPQRVIPRFIDLAMKGTPLILNGGKQIIDFTFIDDVVDGIIKVIEGLASDRTDIIGQDYNFSTGVGTSVAELAKLIKKKFNSSSELTFKKERNYDVQNFVGSCDKAKKTFSFDPKHSLNEGLEIYKKRITDY